MWDLQTCSQTVCSYVCVSVHVLYVCVCICVCVCPGACSSLSKASYQMDVFDISAAKDFPHIYKQPLNHWQVALTEGHHWSSHMFRSSVSVLLCHPLSSPISPLSYIKQQKSSWWKMASCSIFLSCWHPCPFYLKHHRTVKRKSVWASTHCQTGRVWRLHWCQAS